MACKSEAGERRKVGGVRSPRRTCQIRLSHDDTPGVNETQCQTIEVGQRGEAIGHHLRRGTSRNGHIGKVKAGKMRGGYEKCG
jgi:hypothetical protein